MCFLCVWQGEFLAMRMEVDELESEFGLYSFDDGGTKGLAAGLVWVGCVFVLGTEPPEALRHPKLVALVKNLLQIPTLYKTQYADPLESTIRRIVSQNVDAKKLPVSSFEWSEVLLRLGDNITASDAIRQYNSSPEVVAHGGSTETWNDG